MPLETAQYIDTLQPDWPTGSDPESMGDDHLRMVKQVLKNTFPNVDCAISGEGANLNAISMGLQYVAADPDGFNADHWTVRDSAGVNMVPVALAQSLAANRSLYPNQAVCWADIINVLMPVGTVYENYSNAANPSTYLGFGTWVALVGYSAGVGTCTDQYGVSASFGTKHNGGVGNWRVQNSMIVAASLAISGTASSAGAHAHTYTYMGDTGDSGENDSDGTPITKSTTGTTSSAGAHTHPLSGSVTVGSGTTTSGANNVPPYHTTYRWMRTA